MLPRDSLLLFQLRFPVPPPVPTGLVLCSPDLPDELWQMCAWLSRCVSAKWVHVCQMCLHTPQLLHCILSLVSSRPPPGFNSSPVLHGHLHQCKIRAEGCWGLRAVAQDLVQQMLWADEQPHSCWWQIGTGWGRGIGMEWERSSGAAWGAADNGADLPRSLCEHSTPLTDCHHLTTDPASDNTSPKARQMCGLSSTPKRFFVSGENLFNSKRGEGGDGTGATTPHCRDAPGSHSPISNLSGKRCLHCAGMDGSGGHRTPNPRAGRSHCPTCGIWAAAVAAQLCHHMGSVGTEGTAGAIATGDGAGKRENK